ncbi:MAG: hypothetical protein WD379_03945 [Dehalococcoidia bacterium]
MAWRQILVASLLGCAVVFSACQFGVFSENRVKMTFVNESDELLCFNLSSAAAARGGYCDEVKPNGTSVWRPGCDGAGRQPITVVLTLGPGGPELYNRTATCNDWKESGAEFTIEPRGQELVVTDTLPDYLPGPTP